MIPVITVSFLFSSNFHIANFTKYGGFIPFHIQSIFAALPMAGVIYSFIGFNPAIQMAAETKDYHIAIPIAVFGSLTLCIILYTLIQISFIGSLPSLSLIHGWSNISFIGDNGPFAGLLTTLGFIWFVKALYLDAMISPFGTAMVQSMSTSRLTYAMSKNKYFPMYLQKTNDNHAPARAIILNMIIGCLFFLPFPSWKNMVGFLVSCLVIGYIVGPMALMALAQTDQKLFGSIPNWVINCICLLAFYICNLIIFWTGWNVILNVLVLFVIGYVVLLFKIIFNKIYNQEDIFKLNIKRGCWVIIYMLGIAIISYLGSFGGHNNIPFGWDFVIILFFSFGVYMLAYYLVFCTNDSFLKTASA